MPEITQQYSIRELCPRAAHLSAELLDGLDFYLNWRQLDATTLHGAFLKAVLENDLRDALTARPLNFSIEDLAILRCAIGECVPCIAQGSWKAVRDWLRGGL